MTIGPSTKSATRKALWIFVMISAALVGAWGQGVVTVVGSGSDLPRPLYEAWVTAFNQRNAKAQVKYLPLGTAESLKLISNLSGDFGGGELPQSALAHTAANAHLLALPVGLVAIVPVYNVPGLGGGLRFSGAVLADIYLGKILKWDDARLVSLNPGVPLPGVAIQVFHRKEGKGSNYIFSDFLSKASPAFRQQIGTSASPRWVVGRGTERNQDMQQQVAGTAGAIGYVGMDYLGQGLSVGSIQNAAGKFVKASPETVENAAAALTRSGNNDLPSSLTNAPGADSYPLSSFTYIYLPVSVPDEGRARALASFVKFILTDGQEIATKTNRAVLSPGVIQKARSKWPPLSATAN
jgi:phosphate transport system substrate-binding protein